MLATCDDPHSRYRRLALGNYEILARRFAECWLRVTTRIPRIGDSLLGITKFSPADSRNACCVRRPAFRESATRSWELRDSRPPIRGMLAACDDPHSANGRLALGNYEILVRRFPECSLRVTTSVPGIGHTVFGLCDPPGRFAECWLPVTTRIPGIGDSLLGIARVSPADSRNAGCV
jgi:hypothetical protein